MHRFLAAMAFFGLSVAPVALVNAQELDIMQTEIDLESRAADVVAVLQAERPANEVFSPQFLAAVPEAELLALAARLEREYGALQGLENVEGMGPNSGIISLRFEHALGLGSLELSPDPDRLVTGLLINDIRLINDTSDAIRADIEALPGAITVLYAPLDAAQGATLAVSADQQFAIGSTFKLYILSALARSVESGERAWSDVVRLDRKSFPSGEMQDWPDGAPVTLHTLAAMMMSISDNTATDMLLHEVGIEAVEAEVITSGHSNPSRTIPFLSTLQMFALKGSEENRRKFETADETGKRRILVDFEDDVRGDPKLITPPRFTTPTAIDTVEWFASGEDIRKLMRMVVAFPDPTARQIMAINPSLPKARRDEWRYTGFKGGSEPGVLNLTWLLQDENERWHVLTMSWNNPDAVVSAPTLEMLAQRILGLPVR